ncbi:hypothetical protein AQUCO_02900036v1 [Aquilegia coerulea]|uniref:Ribosomal protein eL8/eL30/eS12/Gadd45 domain-containing protein n=1 Tax=Aquilegia coerulea TaxID=218851 RepID=A0A2G5D314_AQUCA|nr:hypothetical protein AQUCO_02900036v1 [Aquilegia coerulea]
MGKSKKKSKILLDTPTSQRRRQQQNQSSNCFEGERLLNLLKSIHREIETANLSQRALPEKVWIKQQFSIGVNDVTRVLERMEPISEPGKTTQDSPVGSGGCKDSSLQLQAVLLSSNCNPRWLAKHVPSLASSRGVPLVFVKDKKGGSLALGKLVQIKTAIAIGIKAKGSGINKLVAEILEKIEAVDDTEVRQVG